MATVKLTGGKVVLKDGKVSCSCCDGPPIECCMYPARDVVLGDLTPDDLPEEVIVTYDLESGVAYTKQDGGYYANPSETIFLLAYNDPSFGDGWIYTATLSPTGEQDVISACLITGDGNFTPDDDAVEDQFAAQYKIKSGAEERTLTRISLCEWRGTYEEECRDANDNPSTVVVDHYLRYDGAYDPIRPWQIVVWENMILHPDNTTCTGDTPTTMVKDSGNMSSPVGSYGPSTAGGNWEVIAA